MPVAYYFDAPVNKAIVNGLRLRGVEAITAQEDGLGDAPDTKILERVTELSRLLVTTDYDFLVLADLWLKEGRSFSGVIFLKPGLSIGYVVEELEFFAKAGEPEDFKNKVIFL